VGSEEEELPFSGWIVAASNRYATEERLEAAVATGEVPGDLVDRFSARIELPPLRARRAEIPAIANNILRALRDARGDKFPFTGVDSDTAARLATLPYDWPGNIRELRRLLQTQARLRRHAGAGRDRLRIPRDELEALLLGAGRVALGTAPADAPFDDGAAAPASAANPFDRDSLREQRLATVVQALQSQMRRENRTRVDSRWVSAACGVIWGIERATGQRLKRSIGLDCTGLSNLLNRRGRETSREVP
jgi:DNA-binding NtrC family response regulator